MNIYNTLASDSTTTNFVKSRGNLMVIIIIIIIAHSLLQVEFTIEISPTVLTGFYTQFT